MDENRHHPSRGDATRSALIGAAIEVFGRSGFHAASTREVAAEAGVNQALIGYHFGGKHGLYLAVFEHIAGRLATEMGPGVEAVRERIDELERLSAGDQRRVANALELLGVLLDRFVDVLSSRESAAWARLIVREQQDPTEAFDRVYEGFMRHGLELVTRLVALTQVRADEERAALVAMTLVGQVLVFRVARAAVLRRMDWDDVGAGEIARIKQQLRENCAAILAGGHSA